MRTLRVTSGPAAGESLEVENEIVIGRDNADLTIPDPQISRRHTLVRPAERGIEIEDLGSLNGTFVNGERISAQVTLTSSGTIRVGDSDIDVELVLDVRTQIAPARAPAAAPTAAGAFASPDPAAPPARGFVQRVDEESQRVSDAPSATPAAAPPRVEPVPRRTQPPAEAPSGRAPRGRRRLVWGLLAAALAVAGAVAAGIILDRSEDEGPTTRPLIASVRTADLVQGKSAITFAGTVNQSPGSQGAVIGRLKLKGDLTKGKAVKLTGTMVFRFVGGRIDATVTGTATQRKDKTTDLVMTGKIVRGTREFEGAKGSFKLKSGQEAATVPTVGISSFEGTIKY